MNLKRLQLFCIAATAAIGIPLLSHAAPGTLSQQPLELQTSVPPNIFFLHDDSESMTAEILTLDTNNSSYFASAHPDGSGTTEENNTIIPPPGCGLTDFSYSHILQTSTSGKCVTAAEEEWRPRLNDSFIDPLNSSNNHDEVFNNLYYNPHKTYSPWPGKDINNEAYANMRIDNARLNPYDPGAGTINLLEDSAILVAGERTYYQTPAWTTWCSTNSIPADDCKGWRYYTRENNELSIHWVYSLTTAEQTNFANWFSYYRSRELAAKYAVAKAIEEAENARIGYGTLNSPEYRLRIDNKDTLSTDSNNITRTHTETLLRRLYATLSSGSTPLRSRLRAVGDYYETGNFFGETGDSPILEESLGGACQLNNTILMTDGFYNGTDSPNVGNADGNNGTPYADVWSNTLADVAMHFYERDISSLPNIVPTNTRDTASHQHMNTYTVGFGLIDPDNIDINTPGFSWSDPGGPESVSIGKIEDLLHAAVNGRGLYLNAQNPDALVENLRTAIRNINGASKIQGTITTSSFRTTENRILFANQYTVNDWSSELEAYRLNEDGSVGNRLWSTHNTLTQEAGRRIITFNGNSGVAFDWDNLSGNQKALLKAGDGTNTGKRRLNYLRGNNSYDNFRPRNHLLGDIINSSPVYVGAPSLFISNALGEDGKRYSDFWNDHHDRTPVVYVGANDGMLHGFNANSGDEVLAYIPAAVFPELNELTSPDYTHQYFVDLTPSVSDVFIAKGGNTSNTDWHSVLVSGLGAGGKGVFALDITDPARFSENNASDLVLWEFMADDDVNLTDASTANDVSDLGYTLAKPVIGLTESGRWVAILGNGYNSDSGTATLFILFLDADISNGWQEGTDYIEIHTQTGTPVNKNGLSSPAAVDSNGNGKIDRVYAGDLQGNLWAFDLSGLPGSWDVAYKDGDTPQSLFTAINVAGNAQPITTKPAVIHHPNQPPSFDTDGNLLPNLMIYVGTGQYLTTNDLNNTETQSFYAVWDNGKPLLDRDLLVNQSISTQTATNPDGLTLESRLTTDTTVPYSASGTEKRYGWYLDLDSASATTGERVITGALVFYDIVFFVTYTPNQDECAVGGSNWFMMVKADTGGFPDTPIISINNDSVVDDRDRLSFENNTEAAAASGLRTESLFGSKGGPQIKPEVDMESFRQGQSKVTHNLGGHNSLGRRISWRELRED